MTVTVAGLAGTEARVTVTVTPVTPACPPGSLGPDRAGWHGGGPAAAAATGRQVT